MGKPSMDTTTAANQLKCSSVESHVQSIIKKWLRIIKKQNLFFTICFYILGHISIFLAKCLVFLQRLQWIFHKVWHSKIITVQNPIHTFGGKAL